MQAGLRRLALALAACAAPVGAQDVPPFTSDFPPAEFQERRTAVYEAIGSEAVALLQGAPSPPAYVRFRQSNDFYYLSGVEVPHAYLLLSGRERRASLFLPHRNEHREKSEGKLWSAEDADEIKQLTGIEAVYATEALGEQLARLSGFGLHTLYTPLQPAEGGSMSRDLALRAVADAASDPWDARPSREGRLLSLLRERLPALEPKNLSPVLDARRLIKSPREIALIERATRLACLALQEGMRSTVPGLVEHELDGLAKFVFFRNGAQGEAYYSLIASGENAFYPHYNAGKRRMQGGELLLMDFAPDVGYYQSDITRMWPVNGRFSREQAELYGFYLRSYRAILRAIGPGKTPSAIMQAAAAEMKAALAETRFTKPVHAQAARKFVEEYEAAAAGPYGLGHWVGMATHDVGPHEGPLLPGMVFTIEPALRVPEEKLYIRLEDLIVIEAERARVVSDWLPADIAAIEALMREEGLLQRYPAAPQ